MYVLSDEAYPGMCVGKDMLSCLKLLDNTFWFISQLLPVSSASSEPTGPELPGQDH